MRVNNGGIESVAFGEVLELLGYAAGGYSVSEPVEEQVAGLPLLCGQPRYCLFPELFWYEEAADFAAFGVDVEKACLDVLNFNLYQLADTCASCGEVTDNEVPFGLSVFFEAGFEEIVVGVADDVFEIGALLDFHGFEVEFALAEKGKVLVKGLDSQVHGFGLERLHQIGFVDEEVPLGGFFVPGVKILYGIEVSGNGVLCHIALAEVGFKFL